MKKALLASTGIGFCIAVPAAWIAAASAIWCAGTGRRDLFVFPFDQWLQVAPFWRVNWWVTLWVIVSAASPTIALILALIIAVQVWRSKPKRASLYGASRWATTDDMAKGGLRLRDKL